MTDFRSYRARRPWVVAVGWTIGLAGGCSASITGTSPTKTVTPAGSSVPATTPLISSAPTNTSGSRGPPTTIVSDPNPYAPSYTTVAALVEDSIYIVIAKVGAPGNGGYPLQVLGTLGFNDPRTPIGVSTAEFDAARLRSGDTYIFFYGVDTVENRVCIVGGARGTFAYDAATQMVTRLDQSTASKIPRTQTLAQLHSAIVAVEQVEAAAPQPNSPPMCSATAGGL